MQASYVLPYCVYGIYRFCPCCQQVVTVPWLVTEKYEVALHDHSACLCKSLCELSCVVQLMSLPVLPCANSERILCAVIQCAWCQKGKVFENQLLCHLCLRVFLLPVRVLLALCLALCTVFHNLCAIILRHWVTSQAQVLQCVYFCVYLQFLWLCKKGWPPCKSVILFVITTQVQGECTWSLCANYFGFSFIFL